MQKLLGWSTAALPTAEALLSSLPAQWVRAWKTRHGDPLCAKNAQGVQQSLGGLLLLLRAGGTGELHYGERGRPALSDPSTDFSITHTAALVLCAFEQRTDGILPRVGVDAEAVSRMAALPTERLAARWFAEAEQAQLQAHPTPAQFARLWTRKESLVKYLGTGLSDLRAADTVTAENNGIRFTEYRVDDVLVTLCHSNDTDAPVRIEMQ